MKVYKGKWYGIYFCSKCRVPLSRTERFDNKGVCPYCANRCEYKGSICDTDTRIFRKVRSGPWYWRTTTHEEGVTP